MNFHFGLMLAVKGGNCYTPVFATKASGSSHRLSGSRQMKSSERTLSTMKEGRIQDPKHK
jgi:hypothetical protein